MHDACYEEPYSSYLEFSETHQFGSGGSLIRQGLPCQLFGHRAHGKLNRNHVEDRYINLNHAKHELHLVPGRACECGGEVHLTSSSAERRMYGLGPRELAQTVQVIVTVNRVAFYTYVPKKPTKQLLCWHLDQSS